MSEDPYLEESTFEVVLKLRDQQADPTNPLYSAKRFEDLGLHQDLLRGIYHMNFKRPSKIQERALPLLVSNPPINMIAQSQSGTGKTAAFVLDMLSRIDYSQECVQALCLAPARELARQIMGVVQKMGIFVGVKTQFAIPQGLPRGAKISAHVVIGTPGTVLDMISRKTLPTEGIRVFVLDEADNMLDQQGLGEQCIRVKKHIPRTAQILLFSATFPHQVVDYANKFAPDAHTLTLRHEELTLKGIRQLYMDCRDEEHKYTVLVDLYHVLTVGSSIIFVKRRHTAEEIQRRMEADGHKVVALHGAFEGRARDQVIDDFRNGRAKVLITTNVLARGLDVATVSMVVNYDMPRTVDGDPDCQTYLHRIGRTGRFGRVGVSISFVYDPRSWEELKTVHEYFGCEITRVPTDDLDVVERIMKEVVKDNTTTKEKGKLGLSQWSGSRV
ncbi:RNA helicase required for poly(A+) mRNA export [Rhizina undulata]